MPSAKVVIKEVDLSSRVPSFPGVYGGIAIAAKKGPVNEPVFITSDTELLQNFTPDERIEVGYDNAYFSAIAFLQKSDKLWVVRAANAALYASAGNKTITATTTNQSHTAGIADPDAYVFDSLNDSPAVAEVTKFTFSQLGSFYDVIGTAKAVQLFNSPAVGHFFWFNVTDGANTQTAPVLTGTAHQVDILSADTSAQVATKFYNAVALVVADFTATNATASEVIVTNVTAGSVTDATATGTACAVLVTTQGVDVVNNVDECLLFYSANPGLWGNQIGYKLITYSVDPDKVKEPGAFIVEVYKSSNLSTPVESFVCSRNEAHIDGYGRNIYVETVLEQSLYLRVRDNVAFASTVYPKDQSSVLLLGGGDDGSAVADSHLITAIDTLSSKDSYPLTILMDGGNTSPAYQLELDSIASSRMDCVAILSVPYVDEASASYMTDIIDYRKTDLNLNSSYSALYTPHVKIYDRFNDRYLYVSPDGFAGGAISASASNYEIWYPAAGFKRGLITVLETRRKFTSGQMDLLYDAQINPIRFTPGKGVAIWGQKTLLTRPSSLSALNVRLLLVTIEPAIAAALEDFLFDLNDETTRLLATTVVDVYMDSIRARRGVTDYRIICDSSNNTSADIDANRMNFDLYVKPVGAVEEIVYRTIITSSGVNLSSI